MTNGVHDFVWFVLWTFIIVMLAGIGGYNWGILQADRLGSRAACEQSIVRVFVCYDFERQLTDV